MEFLRALEQAAAAESEEEETDSERIDAYDLWDLWNHNIDRLCWYDPDGQGQPDWVTFIDTFRQRLAELPYGPTDADWERLDELLLK